MYMTCDFQSWIPNVSYIFLSRVCNFPIGVPNVSYLYIWHWSNNFFDRLERFKFFNN